MRIVRLRALRLPGVEPPGIDLDDLDAPVVVVHGPNASGKSSLARALRALLWAEADGAGIDVEAVLATPDGGTLRVARRVGPPVWSRAGEAVEPPLLAPGAVADGLFLGLDDLVQPDHASVEAAAAAFRRALTGGVDVAGARARTAVGPRVGAAEGRALADCARALRDAQLAQAALEERSLGLEQLGRQIAAARGAADRARTLDLAADLAAERRALAAADEALAGLPEALARTRADDLRTLAQLEERRADAEAALAAARERLATATAAVEASPLGAPLPAGAAAELDDLLDRLARAEVAAAETARAAAARTGAAVEARAALAGDAAAAGASPTPEEVRAALEHADAVHRARRALDELDAAAAARAAPPGVTADPVALDAARRLGDQLDAWLAAPASAGPAPRELLAGAGALALAGLVLAVIVSPWALVLAVVGAALGGLAAAGLRGRGTGDRAAAGGAIPPLAATAGVPAPSTWSEDAVRTARAAARARAARLERAAVEREAAAQAAAELAERRRRASAALAAAEAALGDAHERLALRPELGAEGAAALLRAVGAAAAADGAAAAARAEHEAVLVEVEAARGRLAALLREAGTSAAEPVDAAAARGARDGLVAASDALAAALAARDGAAAALPALEEGVVRARAEVAALFADHGLTDGDVAGLHALVRDLPRHEAAANERAGRAAAVASLAASLGDDAALAGEEAAVLRERAAREREAASRLDELVDRRSALEAELRAAGTGEAVLDAIAARDAAAALLGDVREAALVGAARGLLLERAETEYEAASLPAVQRDAAAWFATFTNGAFELLPPRAGVTGFHARDTRADVVRTLEELSSGTRAQLLLAARLAWAAHAEPDGCLRAPLVLDEALASTDPQRFDAIVGALGAVAADGRQVLILTAEPDEAARVAAAAGCDVAVVDLGGERRGRLAVRGQLPAGRRPVAAPEAGEPYDAWLARIGAARLDPLLGGGAMHVGHLLREDAGLVRRLLALGIEDAGALRTLLASGGATALGLDAGLRRALEQRLAAAREWCDAMSVGRPRLVDGVLVGDLKALRDSTLRPAVVERVDALRGEADGVPAPVVIAVLRNEVRDEPGVPHLRGKIIDGLEQELVERGAIPVEPPLEPAAVVARTLGRLDGTPEDVAAALLAAWEAAATAG